MNIGKNSYGGLDDFLPKYVNVDVKETNVDNISYNCLKSHMKSYFITRLNKTPKKNSLKSSASNQSNFQHKSKRFLKSREVKQTDLRYYLGVINPLGEFVLKQTDHASNKNNEYKKFAQRLSDAKQKCKGKYLNKR